MAAATKKKPAKKKASKPKASASKPVKKRGTRQAVKDFPADCYSVKELAAKEKVLPNTIRAWIADKKIVARQINPRLWAIPKKTYKRPIGQIEASKAYWAKKRNGKKAGAKGEKTTAKKK